MLVFLSTLALAAPLPDAHAWRKVYPLLPKATFASPIELSPSRLPPTRASSDTILVTAKGVRLAWGTGHSSDCARPWEECTSRLLATRLTAHIPDTVAVTSDAPLWRVGMVVDVLRRHHERLNFVFAAKAPRLPAVPDPTYAEQLRRGKAQLQMHEYLIWLDRINAEVLCTARATGGIDAVLDHVSANCEDGGVAWFTVLGVRLEQAHFTATVPVTVGEGKLVEGREGQTWHHIAKHVLNANGKALDLRFPAAPAVVSKERVDDTWRESVMALCTAPTDGRLIPVSTELSVFHETPSVQFRSSSVYLWDREVSCADVLASPVHPSDTWSIANESSYSLRFDADADMRCAERVLSQLVNRAGSVQLSIVAAGDLATAPEALSGGLAVQVPALDARATYVRQRQGTLAACARAPRAGGDHGSQRWCSDKIEVLRTYDVARCDAAFHTSLVEMLPTEPIVGSFDVVADRDADTVLSDIGSMTPTALVAWFAEHRADPLSLQTDQPAGRWVAESTAVLGSLRDLENPGTVFGPTGRVEGLFGLDVGVNGLGSLGTKGSSDDALRGRKQVVRSMLGEVSVTDGLDSSPVRHSLEHHMNQLRYCYQRELNKDPELELTLVVSAVVAPDGSVIDATGQVTDAIGAADAVRSCVTGRFLHIQFPLPEVGTTPTVTAGFRMQSRE